MPGLTKNTQESKNAKRRAAKKAKKQDVSSHGFRYVVVILTNEKVATTSDIATSQPEPETAIPLTKDLQPLENFELDISEDNPLYEQFKNVIAKFQESDKEDPALREVEKPEIFYDDDDDIGEEEEEEQVAKVSKKKRKEQSQLSIAELKAVVKKPDLVDWTDVSSQDPRLLVALKGYRNVVPVPTHWSLKREYLSSKRGVEKPPFALPKFIQETGIAEMRDAVLEKQDQASLKQKQRERVQPKMGKLDIDYQKLYEAFFRHQTKPELTRYGEVYYEGKEYETNLRHLRPGELSDELKEALNIPPGAPPPWLINQQRFGPPPSYPALKVPGLNAPPPVGAQWGFHPGGYGKPPVDEFNRPLYGGDIFGAAQPLQNQQTGEPIERSLWGELQAPEESEAEESEEEEEDDGEEDEEDGTKTDAKTTAGTASVEPSVYGGTESVQGDFTLRKQRRGTETEEPMQPRVAGQVIPEQNVRSQGFFGSDRAYDLKGTNVNVPVLGQEDRSRKRKAGDVDVSVDVDSLERDDKLSKGEVQKRYESQRKAEQGPWAGGVDQDELSKMIAEEGNKRLKKDEERRSRR